jgi:beta-glucosidase
VILGGDFDSSPKVDKDTDSTQITEGSSSYVNSEFNDMGAYSWAVPAVNALYEKGVVAGVGNHNFAPERAVTRAEFITMLMRGFDLVGDEAVCTFTDVNSEDWCYNAIAMASSMGIVNGRPDGTFGVNDQITRQDMSVMCVRLAQAIGLELSATKTYEEFTDSTSIADYAKESVEALCKSGIVNGMGDGSFEPIGQATRAQAAKVIYEMISAQ